VVDDLGEEVVQGLLVRSADIHAGTPPDGLQPFQHFDGGRVVAALARRAVRRGAGNPDRRILRRSRGRAPWSCPSKAAEEVVIITHWDQFVCDSLSWDYIARRCRK